MICPPQSFFFNSTSNFLLLEKIIVEAKSFPGDHPVTLRGLCLMTVIFSSLGLLSKLQPGVELRGLKGVLNQSRMPKGQLLWQVLRCTLYMCRLQNYQRKHLLSSSLCRYRNLTITVNDTQKYTGYKVFKKQLQNNIISFLLFKLKCMWECAWFYVHIGKIGTKNINSSYL